MKPVIAVTGRNGQLGWELERLSQQHDQYEFIFCDRDTLDITNEQQAQSFFERYRPSVLVNCAAYTAVDKAETEQEAAYETNAEAVGLLATTCDAYGTVFISFSTDYVFNGNGDEPYHEDDATDPVNYYGYTKRIGEELALANCRKSIIIRTSWVYSAHGHNFVKTMLRLMKEKSSINVVSDQLGSPTSAKDLAQAVMTIVDAVMNNRHQTTIKGIYHFSNEGVISWFDFATEIRRLSGATCQVQAISTAEYPTPAKRPHYSALDKTKIIKEFGIQLVDWKDSLARTIRELHLSK